MKLNLNPDNYVYQIDYEDLAVSIFSKDDLPEPVEFELSAHRDVYDHIKELMGSSIKMDGSHWNEDYKVWEALTFWDESGESTTVPICGAKLGAFKSLNADELREVLELLDYLEKEDREYHEVPMEPIKINVIDSNGISSQVTAVPMQSVSGASRNGRIYSPEVVAQAMNSFREVNFSNIFGEISHVENIPVRINTNKELTDTMVNAMRPSFSSKVEDKMK